MIGSARALRLPVAGAFLLALAGCVAPKAGAPAAEWRPIGANDTNLTAMIADPRDLLNGSASPASDGSVIAAAVARYRAGKVKTLPASGISTVTATGSAAAPQGAGAE